MSDTGTEKISAVMSILDTVAAYPPTEKVFKSYDKEAGECICCEMLFSTINEIAERYHLDLVQLLARLNTAANRG